jgi:hypothetical protein
MAIINIINERTETDSGSDLDIFGNNMSNSSVTNTVNERTETDSGSNLFVFSNGDSIGNVTNTLNERVETDNGSTLDVFGNNMSNSNIVNTIIERVIGVTYIQTLMNALRDRATYFENEDCTTDTLTNLENI